MTEPDAIALAQDGNQDAFTFLYQHHHSNVYALCVNMTKNPAVAEDLAQDTFMQLSKKIKTFRGESTFATWLFRMTKNVVLMHLRKKRLPTESLDEIQEARANGNHATEIPPTHTPPSLDVIALNRALDTLPPRMRQVFLMHADEGMLIRDIAEKIGKGKGTVRGQYYQALGRMRKQLA